MQGKAAGRTRDDRPDVGLGEIDDVLGESRDVEGLVGEEEGRDGSPNEEKSAC